MNTRAELLCGTNGLEVNELFRLMHTSVVLFLHCVVSVNHNAPLVLGARICTFAYIFLVDVHFFTCTFDTMTFFGVTLIVQQTSFSLQLQYNALVSNFAVHNDFGRAFHSGMEFPQLFWHEFMFHATWLFRCLSWGRISRRHKRKSKGWQPSATCWSNEQQSWNTKLWTSMLSYHAAASR